MVKEHTYNNENGKIQLLSPIEEINQTAFSDFYSCTFISLPYGCKTIKPNAFEGFQNLEEIILPDTIETVGNSAFGECINLKKVTLSSKISTLPNAFIGCFSMTIIARSVNNVNALKSYLDSHDDITFTLIIENVKEIPANLFSKQYDNMNHITLSEDVLSIGDEAFVGFSSRETVTCLQLTMKSKIPQH